MGITPESYAKTLEQINASALFTGTVTIPGKSPMKISRFLTEYADDIVSYYHKTISGKDYFLKYHPQAGIAILTAYKSGTDILIATSSNVFKTKGSELTQKDIDNALKEIAKWTQKLLKQTDAD